MKKRIWLVAACLITSTALFASEELEIYAMMYRASVNVLERYSVLRNVAEERMSGAGSLYAEALGQLLLDQQNLKTAGERETGDALARLLAKMLGDEKYTAAAADLWRVVENFANPLVKADALIAIGQTRSEDYFPQVSRLLTDLNHQPTTDPDAGEKTAYGAVIAMEKYRKLEGYAPVFFASQGWYSRRIKDQAQKTLPFIVDDPSDSLIAIIHAEYYGVKLLALQNGNESKAPPASKSKVALAGLEEGWKAATNDVKDKVTLSQLRKLAIDMSIKNGSSVEAVPLLKKSYEEGFDVDEKLSALTALAVNKTPESARALAGFLDYFNKKRREGYVTQEDERLVRAVIQAMGANGSTVCRPALKQVTFMNEWTGAVKVLAEDALKKIEDAAKK